MNNKIVLESYSFLKRWWDHIDLSIYEKTILNKEIISFNQQLFRLKEKKLRIGIYGKAGVGKSSILNSLLNKDEFKINILNGSTERIERQDWFISHKTLRSIELIDSPGFDFCDIKHPEDIFSEINNTEIILFTTAGDLNRNEVSKINSFLKNGKKIIIILNKVDTWNENDLNLILKNIKKKLPSGIIIPIVVNKGNNVQEFVINTLNKYGISLLTLNSLQMADELFLTIKKERLKKRRKEAQTIIGKFATIKASGVALNPLIFLDIAGSFALDTALINELSKVYGLSLKGKSARNIMKKISFNNIFLGATQIGINTSFNLLRKFTLIASPFTNGLSLISYGPIAVIQAAIAIQSTKTIGKLAAREIFVRSKVSNIDPSQEIQKIMIKEPEIFNHSKIYLSKRSLDKNSAVFLP